VDTTQQAGADLAGSEEARAKFRGTIRRL